MLLLDNHLDNSLQAVPIKSSIKKDIAHNLWFAGDITDLGPYFKHYSRQCDLALHDGGRYISISTHQEVIAIADLLKRGLTRQEVKHQLTSQDPIMEVGDEGVINTSIDLTVRLLLMLEVGRFHNCFSGHKELTWRDGSLQVFVESLFNCPQGLARDHVKLEKVFIARNLRRIARVEVVWTDNLVDHLRLLEHDTQVAIFHHASFLNIVQHR